MFSLSRRHMSTTVRTFVTQRQTEEASNGAASSTSVDSSVALELAEIDQKQMELRGAVQHRIATLERALSAREQQVSQLQTQLRKLEEDYQYNYNLIAERDRAIEEAAAYVVRFDTQLKQANEELVKTRQSLQQTEHQRNELHESLRLQQSQSELKLADIRRQVEALQLRHQKELAEKDAEMQREKDALQQTFFGRMEDDDHARSQSIASLQVAMRDAEASFMKRETALLSEIQQWKAKYDTSRDEVALLRQDAASASLSLNQHAADISRLERLLADETALRREAQETLRVKQEELSATARQQGDRIATLVSENQGLTTALHSATTMAEQAQQRLSLIDTTNESQAAKFQEACEKMRKSHEDSVAHLEQAIRTYEQRHARVQDANAQLQRDLAEAVSLGERRAAELVSAKEEERDIKMQLARVASEVDRLKSEMRQASEKQRDTDNQLIAEKQRVVEVTRQATSRIDDATAELTHLKQDSARKQQAMQSEVTRLTRELHASEAGRQALENQVALLQDDKGLQYQYERTLRENRELEERLAAAQKMNEALRQQVAAFTAELQNDPVIKNARMAAQQVTELQGVVAQLESKITARDNTIRLQSLEMRKYQEEILSQADTARSLHQLSLDHRKLKRDLEDVHRVKELAMATTTANDDCDASHDAAVNALKEADFWRQRAKQLEVALSEALKERDRRASEAEEAAVNAQAAQAEKRSLTDVNNLLRAQLKQAYADNVAVSNCKAVAAPVLASVPPNTMNLAVERVATEHQQKIHQLEDAVHSLQSNFASKRPTAGRPTASSIARTSISKGAASSSSSNNSNGGNAAAQMQLSVEGRVVRSRGSAKVRHYGVE